MVKRKKNVVYAVSEPGPVRNVNQDAVLAETAYGKDGERIVLLAVCDGMGGYSQGEIASAFVVARLQKWFRENLKEIIHEEKSFSKIALELEEEVLRTDRRLKQYSAAQKHLLGSTAVIFLQMGDDYVLINIGDSRAYLYEMGRIEQLTTDQSLVQKKIEEGLITKSEAARSNERSVVLQGVGISMQLKPELTFGKIKKGQNILLCTDGFWRKIEARDFLFLFQKNGNSCKTKLKKVTKDLIQRGETDNLSAVIVTD